MWHVRRDDSATSHFEMSYSMSQELMQLLDSVCTNEFATFIQLAKQLCMTCIWLDMPKARTPIFMTNKYVVGNMLR